MMFKLQEIHLQVKKNPKKSPQVFIITPRQKEITQSFLGSIFLKNLSLWGLLAQIREKMNFLTKLGSAS